MVETLKIMISSTRADLMPYRTAAFKVIDELAGEWRRKWQILPVGMETVTQTGKREYPVELSKKWIEDSDWVVLIVGWHYGTITDEEGADGLSVTEWEYLHAEKKGKKIFVFLAGEEDATDAYEGSRGEKNLALWTNKQTDEQRKKMRDFRGRVGSRVTAFFRNQAHFTDLLARTLRDALHDMPLPIAPGSALAELVLELLDEAFMPCFDSVRLIARSKDIHDVLHDLRQHLIVWLRDQVAEPWQANGELSRPQERLLNSCLKSHGPLLGRLQLEREALDGGENSVLCQHLDLLLARMGGELMKMPYVDETSGKLVQVAEFCETLDGCARSLEKAFSEANNVMLGEQRVFDTLYEAMRTKLDEAASEQRLTSAERDAFKEEITKMAANRERLIDALKVHAGWQTVHDQTVILANLVAASNFGDHLRDFAKVGGPQLHMLSTRVCDALERDGDMDRPLDDALARLAGAIDALGEALAGPAKLADDEIFRRFCTPFDVGFYLVDKRTKRVIARSRERVEDMEKSFRALGKKQAVTGK